MKKQGTTTDTASKMVAASKAGIRKGPSTKNVTMGGKSVPAPSGPTGPLKGMNKGGV